MDGKPTKYKDRFIFYSKRMTWIRIPKVASTSILQVANKHNLFDNFVKGKINYGHGLSISRYLELPQSDFVFTIIRNPLDRLTSAYFNRVCNGRLLSDLYKPFVKLLMICSIIIYDHNIYFSKILNWISLESLRILQESLRILQKTGGSLNKKAFNLPHKKASKNRPPNTWKLWNGRSYKNSIRKI